MSYLTTSLFSKFHLTEMELQTGQSLNEYQRQVIQNLICEAAEAKVALKYDPALPLAFVQQEAELQGQIGILQYLLDCSTHLTLDLPQE